MAGGAHPEDSSAGRSVAAPAGLRLREPDGRWVLLATVLGSGVALLDSTVVTIALPAIGRGLDAPFGALQWTVNGYTLTLAALILLGGSLGDRFGRRRLFVVGTAWFGAASVLCGVAPNVGTLVAARLLQGVGGALLTPGSLALITASFQEADRDRAIGAWSGLGGIAGAVGPLVGGLLVGVSWRLVFFINVPLCAVVIAVARRHVPESRDPDADPRTDVTGAVLACLGLAGVTYALIAAGGDGWSAPVLLAGAGGLVALAAFVVVERRSRHPMLPTGVFAERTFTAANLVTFAVYAALGGVFFLLVVHLQVVAGFSPLAAGTALLPVTVCMLLLSPAAGGLAQRVGPRLPMTAGPLVCAAGVLLMLRIGRHASYPLDVFPAVLLFGLGLSLTVAPLTATVLAAVSDRHAGLASGVNNAVARAAGLMAVAVLPLVAGLRGDDYRDPGTFASAFRIAMLVSAALLAAGGAVAAATIPGGRAVPGGRRAARPARAAYCAVDGPPLQADARTMR